MKKQDISGNQVNKAYLALGSNLGDKKKNIIKVKFLLTTLGIDILKTSSFYLSKSWPDENFPDYINMVILVQTKFKINQLFEKVKDIEKKMGRKKASKNYPRICDIDIIDFNNTYKKLKYLNYDIVVPHKRMHKRNFVLMPLYEINKQWQHPKFKKNIVKLISKLPNTNLRAVKIV